MGSPFRPYRILEAGLEAKEETGSGGYRPSIMMLFSRGGNLLESFDLY